MGHAAAAASLDPCIPAAPRRPSLRRSSPSWPRTTCGSLSTASSRTPPLTPRWAESAAASRGQDPGRRPGLTSGSHCAPAIVVCLLAFLCLTASTAPSSAAPHLQTKDTLTLRASSFGSKCDLPDAFLKKVANCGVVNSILSFASFKADKELKKGDGAKRQRLTGEWHTVSVDHRTRQPAAVATVCSAAGIRQGFGCYCGTRGPVLLLPAALLTTHSPGLKLLSPFCCPQASQSWRTPTTRAAATAQAAPSSSPRETRPSRWRWRGSAWWGATASASSPSGAQRRGLGNCWG